MELHQLVNDLGVLMGVEHTGTVTRSRETLLTAMLTVKSVLKQTSVITSFLLSERNRLEPGRDVALARITTVEPAVLHSACIAVSV